MSSRFPLFRRSGGGDDLFFSITGSLILPQSMHLIVSARESVSVASWSMMTAPAIRPPHLAQGSGIWCLIFKAIKSAYNNISEAGHVF